MEEKEKNITEFIDAIVELPSWVKHYQLNHHSPTQINSADDIWSYKYLYLSQEERRKLPINSKMWGGVSLGLASQFYNGDFEWKYIKGKGLQKVEIPAQRKIIEKVLEEFNSYQPTDDNDRMQHDTNRLSLPQMCKLLKEALQEIGLKKPVECERTISMNLKGCQLPIIGRIDLEDEKNFVELKTKYRKKNRPKKDGTSNYSLPNIKEGYLGWKDHLLQVAYYYFANNKKKKPHLLVLNDKEYKIYTPENCEDLQPNNLKMYLNKMEMVCQRRERMMEKHAGKNTFFKDIEADFDHFFWKGLGEHKEEAMKLWGLKK